MTIQRALEISNLEEGKRRPSVAIMSDAIETLQKDEEGKHDEAVVRIRAIMDGKKQKAPKAVASVKAPGKKPEEPKAEAVPAQEKTKAKPKAKPKATPRVKRDEEPKAEPTKARGNEDLVPDELEPFHPRKMDDIANALQENPYRVFLMMEEEDEKGNPIVTAFRVTYLSKSHKKLVLFDETTQKGDTVTANLADILLSKYLFRDKATKEDFKIQFAIVK